MKTNLLLICTILVFGTGCVQTSLRVNPDGSYSFQTTRGAFTGQIGSAEVVAPDGTKFTIKGYQSNADTLAGAIAEGVTKGLKP